MLLALALACVPLASRGGSDVVISSPEGAGVPEDYTLVVEGTLYEIDSERQHVLYRWRLFDSPDGSRRESRYVTPQGELAASETLVFDGGVFRRYTIVQHGADERGVVRRVGDRLKFSYTEDGETKRNSEDFVPNFVVGPLLVSYIQARWDAVLNGEQLRVRIGITHRARTYGFEVERIGESTFEGEPAIRVRLRPQSFLVAAIVDPILMTFSADGSEIHEVRGRTVPLRKVGDRWKPSVVDAVYRRLAPSPPLARPR